MAPILKIRGLGPPMALLAAVPLLAQQYDVVIANGRVMDAQSQLDAVRNIGVRNGKIAAVTAAPLQGRTTINARGLVVTAGFIDLHSHGQTPENYALKARDGVTTALEMEVGVNPVAPWYAEREGRALINFGATSGHIPARMAVLHDTGQLLPRDAAMGPATPEQVTDVLRRIEQGLQEGALGIGLGVAYTPKATREEIYRVFKIAARKHEPVYVHMRSSGPVEPGAVDALQELLADAAASGASLHIVHITSTCIRETPLCLEMIKNAQAHKADITTEAYPYTAGMTDLASAIFNPGWEQRNGGIGYSDLQWAATGERLTAETFARYRRQGGMVLQHKIPEDIALLAIADPVVMIASDGIMENGKGHPRAAGTYARVLGRYVREQHALTLMDALGKMNLMPAERLKLPNKGRIRIGADADITVFDPQRVIDRATFDNPAVYSEGIPYVLVNGVVVVNQGRIAAGVFPGKGIRRHTSPG